MPKLLLLVLFLSFTSIVSAQQEPQFTQYMYNTMSVNPAYAGQRQALSILALHREQWVGVDGAPKTQTLAIHSPTRKENVGLGLSIVNDEAGPLTETYVDANYSYSVRLGHDLKLALGLKGGFHSFRADWSKGDYLSPDVTFDENISQLSPTFGIGAYLNASNWYLGLSSSNMLETKHYSDIQLAEAKNKIHLYLIAGYVVELSPQFKLKPAALLKAVSGSPLIADFSLNTMLFERLVVGAAWRWDDSFATLAGFQINQNFYVGYSYDVTSTSLNNYEHGSHEILLRYEMIWPKKLISPRFF
ncbi:type IX secretion system membrane protein PorP/SprF [Mangrovibacterium sp.]|uniref:PorP/SprF family type IX secretion system membrane protein n=1 Tax=Mangrovibacterium sp. TaxID=1961364 RepID=UPI0035669727